MPRFTKMDFPGLYSEFVDSGYLESLDGVNHLSAYERCREEGRLNYRSVLEARERGEDVTELVLLKLLPHDDTAGNRERGAWVHIAPAIRGNVKRSFEGARWTRPEDWPAIADAILDLLHWCNEDSELLAEACAEFARLPYVKGFEAGMLTPILNALRPADYLLISYKSRRTISYFSEVSYGLEDLREGYEPVEGGELEAGMLVCNIGGNARDGSVPTGENVVETITDILPASPSGGREFVNLVLKRVDTGTQRTKYLSKTKRVVAKVAKPAGSATPTTRSQGTRKGGLMDYPEINLAGWRLIEELTEEMNQPGAPELSDADRFDMFSHWLVAEREYPFPDRRYWKVAPGEKGWQWEECEDNGFIGIGWNDVGDVSGLSRAEFDVLQEKIEAERGYKKEATNQVWTFAHDIQEGDVIVANRGIKEILGFGTVVGPYEFVPDGHYAHQFPVRWDDTVPRRIDEKGWRRTLIEIKPEQFEELRAAPPLDSERIEPERSYWWVNQGTTYRQERGGGYLWAPKETKGGRVLSHHADLLRVREGDVVLHYANGALRAVSEVLESAVEAPRPSELPADSWNTEGNLLRARYHELSSPVPLGDISHQARVTEGGPFTQHGTVKQGYFFPVASEFFSMLAADFPGRFPGALMSPPKHKRVWLFQANPAQWNLKEHVRSAHPGDEDDWTVSRFREDMSSGDTVILWQGGAQAGVYAIGELLGEPFERELPSWRPPKEDSSRMEWAIRYRYEHILRRPIFKNEFLEDSVLKDLQVLRAPQGTNFKVTEKEWVALQALLDGLKGYDYHEPSWKEIASTIVAQGMRIEERDLRRYHQALKSRGFVILSGVSGTGKTWLTEAYARAVEAECLVVPVAPNWTTNEDLLGYFNPLDGEYHDTRFSRFLRNAASEYKRAQVERRRAKPYHLVLDEMNLARVEYYFAKFLSALEVRVRYGTATVELGPHEEILLPPNLRFAGTVNVDETTHGFADKVYDRAQLIELQLRREDLAEHLGDAPYREVLMKVWDVTHSVAPFAFRVLDDIQAYVLLAEELGVPWEEALDEQLLQKVLPKLKGADLRVGEALEGLVMLTAEDLPLSNTKATKMLEEFRLHGFTSFF